MVLKYSHIHKHTGKIAVGRIDAVIPDDLEKKLRIRAIDKFGGKKGSLTDAVIDAIQAYVAEEATKARQGKEREK